MLQVRSLQGQLAEAAAANQALRAGKAAADVAHKKLIAAHDLRVLPLLPFLPSSPSSASSPAVALSVPPLLAHFSLAVQAAPALPLLVDLGTCQTWAQPALRP